ncbi:MAG: AAA family ATPase [Bacteroidetes bacterium]|nr:AAA family ATPase [Bacteroidota bacterium]
MIFRQVVIENFLCYHRISTFDFSSGLNIILGDNGEGKTKFIEAMDWLLNERDWDPILLASAKAISELQDGGEFKVGVQIVVEHLDETQGLKIICCSIEFPR